MSASASISIRTCTRTHETAPCNAAIRAQRLAAKGGFVRPFGFAASSEAPKVALVDEGSVCVCVWSIVPYGTKVLEY